VRCPPLLAQLRPYYEAPGSSETPAAADSRRQVLGLWLLHLLVTAARPQFYAEVELLSPADRASAYISFVLQLEACFAEGAHNRVRFCAQPRKVPHGAFFGAALCPRRPLLPHVARAPPLPLPCARAQILTASQSPPSEFYAPFVARLADTAREDLADCAAAAYRTLSLAAAQKLLMLSSRDELRRFLRERRPAFAVVGDALVFAGGGADKSAAAAAAGLDAVGLLGSTLAYAADLERII